MWQSISTFVFRLFLILKFNRGLRESHGWLLDENLSDRIVPRIIDLFPGSQHVKALDLLQCDDRVVAEYAKKGYRRTAAINAASSGAGKERHPDPSGARWLACSPGAVVTRCSAPARNRILSSNEPAPATPTPGRM